MWIREGFQVFPHRLDSHPGACDTVVWSRNNIFCLDFSFSFFGDEENELFKGATLKVPRPKVQSEEEDEDEVVRRSQALPSPHATTWGPLPTGSEKRHGVCWWPTPWALCARPCGSRLGAGRQQLCKRSGDGHVPLYS